MRLWEIEALSVREGSLPGIGPEGQLPGAVTNSQSRPEAAIGHSRDCRFEPSCPGLGADYPNGTRPQSPGNATGYAAPNQGGQSLSI